MGAPQELPGCWWPTCTRNAPRPAEPGKPAPSCCIACPAGHTPACDARNGVAE